MLIETPGGFDYTGVNCSVWTRRVGFRETRVAGPLVLSLPAQRYLSVRAMRNSTKWPPGMTFSRAP